MKIRSISAVLFALVFMLSGCNSNEGEIDANSDIKPVAVSVVDVAKTSIENIATVNGKIKPLYDVNVLPKIPGTVKEVNINVGDSVKKGDVLFTLEDKDIKLQVNQAKAALDVAKANLDRSQGGSMELQLAQLQANVETAQVNLNDAKSAYDNTKSLYESGAASKQSLDAAESRYKIALEQFSTAKQSLELTKSKINNENINAAKAQVQQAQAAYETAKIQLDNTVITSPVDGIVSSLNIDEGEMASNASPAITLVNLSTVIAEIDVTGDMVNKLQNGQTCDILIKSVSNESYNGVIKSISPNADPRLQTYKVTIELNNEDAKIKGGMFAQVRLTTEKKENVLVVPIDSVVNENGRNVIYTVKDDKAVRIEVETGMSDENNIEVSGEINENDKVIIKGQNFVKDNSKVEVKEI